MTKCIFHCSESQAAKGKALSWKAFFMCSYMVEIRRENMLRNRDPLKVV